MPCASPAEPTYMVVCWESKGWSYRFLKQLEDLQSGFKQFCAHASSCQQVADWTSAASIWYLTGAQCLSRDLLYGVSWSYSAVNSHRGSRGYYSPHSLHGHGFKDMSPTCCVHGKAPEEQTKQMVIQWAGARWGNSMFASRSVQVSHSEDVVLKSRDMIPVYMLQLFSLNTETNSPVAIQVDLCIAPQRQHHADRTAFTGRMKVRRKIKNLANRGKIYNSFKWVKLITRLKYSIFILKRYWDYSDRENNLGLLVPVFAG